jgi:hypothetical protein
MISIPDLTLGLLAPLLAGPVITRGANRRSQNRPRREIGTQLATITCSREQWCTNKGSHLVEYELTNIA